METYFIFKKTVTKQDGDPSKQLRSEEELLDRGTGERETGRHVQDALILKTLW